MSRRGNIGTIFWGAILIAAGVLLLLRNLGYSIPVWSVVARYWPVLLIVWGVMKLVDYFLMKRAGNGRPLFSGGEVALLVIVILAGTALTATASLSANIADFFNIDGNFDFFDVLGNNFEFKEHHEAEAPQGSTIEINNLYGSVDVRPAEGNRIIVDVQKTVRAATREEAERLAPAFSFSIKGGGTVFQVESNRDQLSNFDRRRYKSSLTVQVPRQCSVQLVNKYGGVTVAGISGDHSVETKYGGTTIRNISGAVRVEDGYGPVVVEGISGNVNVVNKYGSITVKNVGGVAEIENKYGSIDVSDVRSGAVIYNKYSAVSVENVRGDLKIEGKNNSVDIEKTVGLLSAETSYKELVVRNASGPITVRNRHGGIRLSFEQPPRDPIDVTAEYADVALELPSAAAFTIDGHTRSGSLDSDFEGLQISSSGRDRRIRGQLGGGGPRITIETTYGSIRLGRRS